MWGNGPGSSTAPRLPSRSWAALVKSRNLSASGQRGADRAEDAAPTASGRCEEGSVPGPVRGLE